MPPTIFLLIAFGGIGCQNPGADVRPIPPAVGQPAAPVGAATPAAEPKPVATQPALPSTEPIATETETTTTPMVNSPASIGNHDFHEDQGDDSFRECVRDTLWSFVLGRSPDVPSAREIEAAYRAGLYSR